jgi:nitrile hydratase accessory protein
MSAAGKNCTSLADLPLLPRDAEGPVFAEPWQAQAFAVVAELIESGKISRDEWAESLGAVLKEAEERGEYDTGARYYDHWLLALEELVVEKGLAGPEELGNEKEEIEANDHHRREHQLGHEH